MVHLVARDNAGNRRWVNLNGRNSNSFDRLDRREHCRAERLESHHDRRRSPEDVWRYISLPTLSTFLACPYCWGAAAAIGCAEGQDPENVTVLVISSGRDTTTAIRHCRQENPAGSQELRDRGCSPAAIYLGRRDVYLPLKLTADPVRTFSL